MDLAVVVVLLVASIAMFAVGRPRMDVVAVVMIVALPLTGILTVPETLAGFADPNVMLIAAVLMAPIAITAATELGASALPFAMIIALAASCAFMTPVSSPVNTLVVEPGRYRFGDFVKVGVPFTLVVLVVSVVLVPIVLPLY
ncbi:SLC13 family permease [Microbacterium sp. C7(2022)]|uniref:SLC13 family permease n=1 Tax=Microbacterium sp. C7(2022) TaxID=2992759 RepID=UPI00237C51B8|nr:anion permease [Microbacterium sp. C7(2022)]